MSRIKTGNRIFISMLFTGVLFVAAESRGDDQPFRASLSVKADAVRTRDRTKTVDQKATGTVTTVADIETETCTLEIEVSNEAKQSGTYQLEWYFISKKTSPKGEDELVIMDAGVAPVTLDADASTVKKAVSKPFIFTTKDVETESKKSTSGPGIPRRTRSGDEYSGYIVRIKAGDEILDTQSNSSRFLKDEWLEKCAAFVPAKAAAPKKKK